MAIQEGVAIEITEVVVGALQGGLDANAVNAPMVPAEVMSELSPYVVSTEKLGRLVVQLVAEGSVIKSMKVVSTSPRDPSDLDTRLLQALITKSIIEPISDTYINLVNVDYTSKQKGLWIIEERNMVDYANDCPIDSIHFHIANFGSRFASPQINNGEMFLPDHCCIEML